MANALIPTAAGLPASIEESRDNARSYVLRSKADSTVRAYRSDWETFTRWCEARRVQCLPADPEDVAGFLADEAKAGRKAATITRRAAAIRYHHRIAGIEHPPTATEA